MTNNQNKEYIVYSLRLANRLAYYGFSVKRVGINKNNPKYNVYFYEDSAELRQVVEEYKKNPYQNLQQ